MTGVAAAILFPTLKALEPKLATYPAYSGEHWMLAAGKVAEKLFYIADIISFACATIGLATLLFAIVVYRASLKNPLMAVRISVFTVAIALLSFKLMVLQPRMNVNLRTYWTAAAAGDQKRADEFQAAFSADHPTASNTIGALTLVVGLLFFLAALPAGTGALSGTTLVEPRRSPYEEPLLAKRS